MQRRGKEGRKKAGRREREERQGKEGEGSRYLTNVFQCILMSSSQHDCTPPFLQTSIVTPAHTISLLSYEPSAYLNHIIRNHNLFLFSTIFLD